jgi:hypothetical protein
MCRCEPLRGSGYGHMADGFGAEQAVHRTAGLADFHGQPSSVTGPPGPGEITGDRRFRPRMATESVGNRRTLLSGVAVHSCRPNGGARCPAPRRFITSPCRAAAHVGLVHTCPQNTRLTDPDDSVLVTAGPASVDL